MGLIKPPENIIIKLIIKLIIIIFGGEGELITGILR